MTRTILLTGATSGLGLATAEALAPLGHRLLLHGRDPARVQALVARLGQHRADPGGLEPWVADLSSMEQVHRLADAILARHDRIDVLVNNAGIFKADEPRTEEGLDLRFAVNALAPYLLTLRLLPLLDRHSRVVNLSSAAQSSVDPAALRGEVSLDHGAAYAQSKLALTMWSQQIDRELGGEGPAVIAVNPGSFLATRMVREAYGVGGNDPSIGVEILLRAALADAFADAGGRYYDNDHGRFAPPHPDARDPETVAEVMNTLDDTLRRVGIDPAPYKNWTTSR